MLASFIASSSARRFLALRRSPPSRNFAAARRTVMPMSVLPKARAAAMCFDEGIVDFGARRVRRAVDEGGGVTKDAEVVGGGGGGVVGVFVVSVFDASAAPFEAAIGGNAPVVA